MSAAHADLTDAQRRERELRMRWDAVEITPRNASQIPNTAAQELLSVLITCATPDVLASAAAVLVMGAATHLHLAQAAVDSGYTGGIPGYHMDEAAATERAYQALRQLTAYKQTVRGSTVDAHLAVFNAERTEAVPVVDDEPAGPGAALVHLRHLAASDEDHVRDTEEEDAAGEPSPAAAPGDPHQRPRSSRPAELGELCTCGRQAATVYLGGEFGDTGYCGRSDGGAARGPCPFCGAVKRHSGRCPKYTLRLPAAS